MNTGNKRFVSKFVWGRLLCELEMDAFFTLLEKNNKSTTGFKSNARYLEGVISGVDGRRNTIVR